MASPANIQIIGHQYDQEQLHHRTRLPNMLILRMVWERANTARRKAVNCNSVLVTFSHNCEFDLDLWPHDLDLVSTLRSHQYLLYVQVSSRSHYPFMIYKRKKLVGDGRTDGKGDSRSRFSLRMRLKNMKKIWRVRDSNRWSQRSSDDWSLIVCKKASMLTYSSTETSDARGLFFCYILHIV